MRVKNSEPNQDISANQLYSQVLRMEESLQRTSREHSYATWIRQTIEARKVSGIEGIGSNLIAIGFYMFGLSHELRSSRKSIEDLRSRHLFSQDDFIVPIDT